MKLILPSPGDIWEDDAGRFEIIETVNNIIKSRDISDNFVWSFNANSFFREVKDQFLKPILYKK